VGIITLEGVIGELIGEIIDETDLYVDVHHHTAVLCGHYIRNELA